MKISSKDLNNTRFTTKSGQNIGKLESFVLDIDSQSIIEYHVKPASILKNVTATNLIISRGQVVEITKDKVVVEDTYLEKKDSRLSPKKTKKIASQAVYKNT